jgi:hypothetical protein
MTLSRLWVRVRFFCSELRAGDHDGRSASGCRRKRRSSTAPKGAARRGCSIAAGQELPVDLPQNETPHLNGASSIPDTPTPPSSPTATIDHEAAHQRLSFTSRPLLSSQHHDRQRPHPSYMYAALPQNHQEPQLTHSSTTYATAQEVGVIHRRAAAHTQNQLHRMSPAISGCATQSIRPIFSSTVTPARIER